MKARSGGKARCGSPTSSGARFIGSIPPGPPDSWDAPSEVGFLAPFRDGRFLAGAKTGLYDFDPAAGSFALIRTIEPDQPGNRLNDGAVDAKGRLWFGSMDDGEGAPTGKLYRLDAGGLAAMDSGTVITNGPAFSPDGGTLYHTDTLGKIDLRFRHRRGRRAAQQAGLC